MTRWSFVAGGGVQAHTRAVRVRGGAHGWNIDYGWFAAVFVLVRFGVRFGDGTGGVVVDRLGTLLGPEGTGRWPVHSGCPGVVLLCDGVVWWWGDGSTRACRVRMNRRGGREFAGVGAGDDGDRS